MVNDSYKCQGSGTDAEDILFLVHSAGKNVRDEGLYGYIRKMRGHLRQCFPCLEEYRREIECNLEMEELGLAIPHDKQALMKEKALAQRYGGYVC